MRTPPLWSGPSGCRPRVLYLAFYFPPTRASGVYRALATANHLADAGWDVTVLTAPREFFTDYIKSHDDSLERRVHPEIRVERPGMGYFRWERDIRRYGTLRGNFPALANAAYHLGQRHLFPEHYATWIPRVLGQAARMQRQHPFDVVLATGNPFASFAAAWLLRRLLRVPYVVDYRDPWTLNPLTEELNFPPGSPAWRWEHRVLRDASEAAFVNEPIRRWYAQQYPFAARRMTVVPNGWEPHLMRTPEPAPRPPGRPLRFCYVGTMTDQLPLEQFFEGWRRARQHPELAGAELHLYGHLGFFPQSAEPLLNRMSLGDEHGAYYRGPVPKGDVSQVYQQADGLVFLAGGSTYVTSGKIFEYMATGKPVVSVHRPGIAAAEVLDGYPQWFGGDSVDPDAVAHSMIEAGRAASRPQQDRVEAARRHAERFTRTATLSPLETRLRRMVGAPSQPHTVPEALDV